MNVSLQNIDKVSALLTVKLEKADYQEKVDKALKSFRQKAQMPGFRKGMIPMSLIKKMYGKSVLAEEVNKLLSETVSKYIQDNKVNILGEPLPNEDKQPAIDFDTMDEFEFLFDIALAPDFKVEVSADDKVDYYDIEVSDEMVNDQIKAYTQRNGKYEKVDAYADKDMLKGLLAELDEAGNTKEGGIQVEGAVMMPAYMKNDEQKAVFANAKVNDVLVFNPHTAWDGNPAELASLLKVDKEAAVEVKSNFSFQVEEITRFVGDTVTHVENPASEPLPGYKEALPMVFSGMYPVDNEDYHELKEALEKLKLSDSSITFEPETSSALGFGFRCGFLGMLHMEIAQERLEREYNLSIVTTAPSVVYRVHKTNGEVVEIDNPANLPAAQYRDYIEEPYVKVSIITPNEYVGTLMDLAQTKRGIFINMTYLDKVRVDLIYHLPLSEVITDFYDQLKSRSKGYASLDYEFEDYKRSKLVKLDIMLAGEVVDALSVICHEDSAYYIGQKLTEKLKTIIPRQMFEVPIQAAIGGRIIARTNIKALRKSVLDKCYGGDITRKRKLLEKQKRGKKRMKAIGRVEVPQEAFMAVLSLEDE